MAGTRKSVKAAASKSEDVVSAAAAPQVPIPAATKPKRVKKVTIKKGSSSARPLSSIPSPAKIPNLEVQSDPISSDSLPLDVPSDAVEKNVGKTTGVVSKEKTLKKSGVVGSVRQLKAGQPKPSASEKVVSEKESVPEPSMKPAVEPISEDEENLEEVREGESKSQEETKESDKEDDHLTDVGESEEAPVELPNQEPEDEISEESEDAEFVSEDVSDEIEAELTEALNEINREVGLPPVAPKRKIIQAGDPETLPHKKQKFSQSVQLDVGDKSEVPPVLSKTMDVSKTVSEKEPAHVIAEVSQPKRPIKESSTSSPLVRRPKSAGGVSARNKGKAVAVEGVVADGVWFASEHLSKQWSLKKEWTIVSEKVFDEALFNVPFIHNLLMQLNIMNSLTMPKPSDHHLVLEVVGNLDENFADKRSPDYGVVYVRGYRVVITPEAINEYLGMDKSADPIVYPDINIIAWTLAGGKITEWPRNKMNKLTSIVTSTTTSLYAILHSILVSNWIPTTHRQSVTVSAGNFMFALGKKKKVNLGQAIFDNLASHINCKAPKHPISNPSIIYELVMKQAPQVKKSGDRVSKDLKKIVIDFKFFEGNHEVDVDRVSKGKSKVKQERPKPQSSKKSFGSLSDSVLSYFTQRMNAIEEEQKALRELFSKVFDDMHASVSEESENDSESESSM